MASLHEGTDHGALPPAQLQAQHYLLSPVPASQAPPSSSKPGPTGTTPDSTTSVNLYPLEPVPPHLLCAICTLPYENPVHFLPCCHVFCLECIQLWIGMNLSDDLLQNELRRAYPAGDDLLHASSLSESEPFTYELARMDNDRSRSGTSGAFYDSYSGLPPMAQVHQRQAAIILENREMPKCPMCRTALHIHGWDRIEEQIKVPISVGPRPQSTPSTEWFERSANQRPVSGVQRRRLRSDRNHLGRRGLGRQDSIGEEDEEEEIEMEHVGARGQDVSSSPSSFGRHLHSRRDRTNPSQHHQFPRPVYPNGGFNYEDDDMDIDDQQSPTTAIIGRRPSEWMRYQQRQLQAHQAQQQSNRQQSNQTSDRYDDQQEQIRRLYLEQESQEELLRTLTARAASILEAGNAQRQTPPNTALSSSTHSLSTTQSGATPENNERDLSSDDREGDQQNTQLRRSMLHVDTSVTRSSSRQSQERSRQVSREVPSPRSPETAIHFANRTEASTVERDGDQNQDDQEETSDDNSSIIDALQQGTRAWQRPSSLRLDLEESEQRLVLSLGEAPEHGAQSDGESQGYSRSPLSSSSVSSATPSSGVQSSTLALSSPTNTHSFSFRTSSTFSHHMTQMSSDTTFSQQSPGLTNQWDQPLGLQMPTIDNDRHHDEMPSTGPGSVGLVLERESLDDNLEEMWRGTQTETLEEAPSSTGTRTNEDQHLETTGDEQTEETGSTSLPGSITSSTSESQHPTYFLQSSEIHIWKSAGSSSTSGASPMVRELDIHSPIVTTTEGSETTIADMQIDADILARARSGSVVLSDDDEALPATFFRTHRHSPSSVTSSPIDSPIPTPSTARPRQRFPAGIRLVGEGDEEVEQEDVDEEEEEAYEHAQEEEVAAETVSHRQSLAPAEVVQESSDTTDVLEEEHQQQDEVVDDPLSNQPETQGIQDPLSTIETPNLQESVPRTTSLRSTMSSPPPLPVPLDTTEDGVGGEPSSLAAELNRAAQQEHTTPGRSRPTSVDHSRHQSAQDRNGASTATSRPASIHAQTQATSDHAPQAQQAQAQTQVEEEEEEEAPQPWPSSSSRSSSTPPASTSSSSSPSSTGARRTEDHVQYRTLVRYQPRLPKAHVMSDLISQIKVECPQRTHGCLETMEMQQMPQHGREQCRFRPVMCPRARCGLWMRADQILEHILMVEQPAPAANGTLGSTTRPQSNKSSTRRLNRTPRGSAKDEVHSHAASSTSSGNSTSSLSPSPSSSLIPPCPGLTWEREQLARATGIIGQLNEENTSLRQMVRQLQQQNSKLVKEKDRFQRYANLVGRD
ncbi:hypothetical protein BGZ74_003439 [Mortierella antarctica]|nr:hypothetical protein BGZ74_003439 [Mortierella antarctica]